MAERIFQELIEGRWNEGKFACVGLDTDLTSPKFPESARRSGSFVTMVNFNGAIVEATHDLVCAYKPNVAFYEALGVDGISALMETVDTIHELAPTVPVIGDMKRGDIGNTNLGYIQAAFDLFGFDAITVHPYLGAEDGMQPFLDRKDKGIIVLARTSNKGSSEFQDLHTLTFDPARMPQDISAEGWIRKILEDSMSLHLRVAKEVATRWNKHGNCGVVAGATFPAELGEIRRVVGNMLILIPAIGAQGGDVEKAVKYGMSARGSDVIFNSSRAILFASSGPDFAEAARRETLKLHEMISQYRRDL